MNNWLLMAMAVLSYGLPALAESKSISFQPLTVECSISATKFPGVGDRTGNNWKKVNLTGVNSSKGGHQLVDKIGEYEFWVVTGETLGEESKRELFTYWAEIRNNKTGITAQARSDDNVKSVESKAIKYASVGLVTYPEGSLTHSSSLSMTCMHHAGQPAETLKFSH